MAKALLRTPILVVFSILVVAGIGYAGTQLLRDSKIASSPKEQQEFSEVDTSDWKTYRNEEYGFEVKYPSVYYAKPTTEEKLLPLF
jgi:hypothetical protein